MFCLSAILNCFSFFYQATLLGYFIVYIRSPKGVIWSFSIYCCHFFVIFSSIELTPFLMNSKYVLIFILAFDLALFFSLFVLMLRYRDIKVSFLRKKKMHKNNWMTQWTETNWKKLKVKICLLALYLNHFNESKLKFGRTLRKRFWFLFLFSAA